MDALNHRKSFVELSQNLTVKTSLPDRLKQLSQQLWQQVTVIASKDKKQGQILEVFLGLALQRWPDPELQKVIFQTDIATISPSYQNIDLTPAASLHPVLG